jgi:hypothetical protein
MATVDKQIRTVGANISDNIASQSHDRALLAQNILSQLRNLVEAVAVRLYKDDGSVEFSYDLVNPAMDWIGSGKKQINFIHRFHKLLQLSASHYTLEGDASERLMLKYYEYLLRIRTLVKNKCKIDILPNLEDFPVDLDPSLREYHEKIAERIRAARDSSSGRGRTSRYYVHKARPFFTGGQIFYEVTFSNAANNISKFDRMIAFTHIDMTDKYAANLTLVSESIDVFGHTMPIMVIRKWEVSVRPCEFDNFAKIFGQSISVRTKSAEYRNLMRFLTVTGGSLLDLMDVTDARYAQISERLTKTSERHKIFPMLDAARKIIRAKSPGCNMLRYLMLKMNNRIIKLQYDRRECLKLSNLRLSWSCIPFDDMPFCSSPCQHNPRFADLAASLDATGRTHELLARRVRNNVEVHGMLYTPVSELESFGSVSELVASYNEKIYHLHTERQLVQDKDHVFLRGYEDGAIKIIERLREYAASGIAGYEAAVNRFLAETKLGIDDGTKKDALKALFTKSRVALIYGAAGTGKSTMVNYIANYFGENRKLFLTHTNPALDNLKRKVSAQNAEFRTVRSQNSLTNDQPEYDILVVDESSTFSNSDLPKVLKNTKFKLVVLVGDVYQIESIQFGNWFSVIRSFLPEESVFELTKPFRTKDEALLGFWTKVRCLDYGVEESIAYNGYSRVLDQSLFERGSVDEFVLCLNYDGLYGINNINRFLQSSNPGKEVKWGVTTYKVGDPVLFNDTGRFRPLLYNNLKGRIENIRRFSDRIQFDISLERNVTEFDVVGDLRYVNETTVSFDVHSPRSTDEDDDSINCVVPFQVAYAVSIHKAQGLEYESVKIVITEANEEDISHNIFYTAITRARTNLKIFWTPETQTAVLGGLRSKANDRDVALLKARRSAPEIL